MKSVSLEIGSIIREFRIKNNMTQLDLSNRLGYDSTQFVSLFERGLSKVPLNTLGQLVIILGIPEKRIMKILLGAYQDQLVSQISEGKASATSKGA